MDKEKPSFVKKFDELIYYCKGCMESILKSARNNDSWVFGSFYKEEAVDILELAKEYNMNIEMINEDNGE